MASQVPYSNFSGNWCNDGLHMSPKGYQVFGERLGNLMRGARNKDASSKLADATLAAAPQTLPKLRSGRNLKQLLNQPETQVCLFFSVKHTEKSCLAISTVFVIYSVPPGSEDAAGLSSNYVTLIALLIVWSNFADLHVYLQH